MEASEAMRKKYEESIGERWGCDPWNPKYCEMCKYANGEPPWADLPGKSNCKVYRYEDGLMKPYDVVHFGAECEFFEPK